MSFEQKQAKHELSSVLREVADMDLHYADEQEFERVAREDSTSRETSEDAFLRIAKKLVQGERPGPNTWGATLRILERDSMKDHPKAELFMQAVEELADRFGYELKLGVEKREN